MNEVLYFLSGEGEHIVGEERHQIRAGMLLHIPDGMYHETMKTGWELTRLVAI